MQLQLLVRSFAARSLFLFVTVASQSCIAAENVSALDLVSADTAFLVEVPHLDETWSKLERSPLMQRLRAIPAWLRLLESRGFQQWQTIDEHVARQTGQTLTAQLRALVGRSLILAVYVPAEGPPRGILIGEAIDRTAVETAIATRNKLEPTDVVSFKTHDGVQYEQRKKHAADAQNFYLVTFDRWFAISDQESLIHDVIDRFAGATRTTPNSPATQSLGHSNAYLQNMQRLKPGSAAYLYINARPWDRGLEEASRNEHDPINPATIWNHISAVSACLQLDQGIVCEAVVELETTRLPSGWTQFVAIAATDVDWSHRIPPEAVLAISGHVELAPVLRFIVRQVPPRDQPELAKNRRIAQSLLGGNELVEAVLPALARDFSACVVSRKDDRSKRMVLDADVQFVAKAPADAKMLRDVAHSLELGLNVAAAFFSAGGPGVVTVQRQQTDSSQMYWLSGPTPVPIAFGLKSDNLVIAGSPEQLQRTFDTLDRGASRARLAEHAERFFPKANQLVWFDTAITRELLRQNSSDIALFLARGSADEAARLANRFEQAQPVLSLVDSLFIAGRIESDHVRMTFGGGLDAK